MCGDKKWKIIRESNKINEFSAYFEGMNYINTNENLKKNPIQLIQ